MLEWFANDIRYEVLLNPVVARARMKAGSEEVNEWGVQIIKSVFINENRRYEPLFRFFSLCALHASEDNICALVHL